MQLPADCKDWKNYTAVYLEEKLHAAVEGASREKIEFLYCEKRKSFYADKREIRAKRFRGFSSLKNAIQKHLSERIEKVENTRDKSGKPSVIIKIELSRISRETVKILGTNKKNFVGYTPNIVEMSKEPELEIVEIAPLEKIVDSIDLTGSSPERVDSKEELAQEIKDRKIEDILIEMETFSKHIMLRFEIRPGKHVMVHLSSKTKHSHIGETILEQLSERSTRKREDSMTVVDHLNGNLEIKYECTQSCTLRIRYASLFFEQFAFVVPNRVVTPIFAPVRIELGRDFVKRYVKDIDSAMQTIELRNDNGETISAWFDWKKKPDIYQPRNQRT